MSLSWIYYVLIAIPLGIVVSAGWAIYDSLRPKRKEILATIVESTGQKREPIVLYQLYFGAFIVLFLVTQVMTFVLPGGAARSYLDRAFLIMAIATVFVILVYLLRVVFPAMSAGDVPGYATAPQDFGGSSYEELSKSEERKCVPGAAGPAVEETESTYVPR